MGQRAAATGVKFRLGSPSTLGEKVASGLVWRFITFDYISDNLACFEDDFGDNGSFLDVGGHPRARHSNAFFLRSRTLHS
jgi:hypothetical protein